MGDGKKKQQTWGGSSLSPQIGTYPVHTFLHIGQRAETTMWSLSLSALCPTFTCWMPTNGQWSHTPRQCMSKTWCTIEFEIDFGKRLSGTHWWSVHVSTNLWFIENDVIFVNLFSIMYLYFVHWCLFDWLFSTMLKPSFYVLLFGNLLYYYFSVWPNCVKLLVVRSLYSTA